MILEIYLRVIGTKVNKVAKMRLSFTSFVGFQMIVIAVICLIFVGLLFGFNIQVSDSLVSVIGSLGTMVGGVGAAFAAFISYRSIGQWRKEFTHGKLYELTLQLEDTLHDALADLHEAAFSESIPNKLSFFSVLPRSIQPYRKSYERVHDTIRLLLESDSTNNEKALELLKKLTLDSLLHQMHSPFVQYHDSQGRVDIYLSKNPNEQRSLFAIPEIKEDLMTTTQMWLTLGQIELDYKRNMTSLKSLLLSKQVMIDKQV